MNHEISRWETLNSRNAADCDSQPRYPFGPGYGFDAERHAQTQSPEKLAGKAGNCVVHPVPPVAAASALRGAGDDGRRAAGIGEREAMTNTDTRLAGYKARLLRLEDKKREAAEDIKEVKKEMKGAGLSKAEIAGVVLAVKREFESDERKATRTLAEEIADMLAASGDAPLFGAAA